MALLGLGDVLAAELPWVALVGMTVASFAVGYASLFVLFAMLRRGRFRAFSPYLWAVSALTLGRALLT